jgi:hypothetical protein
MRWVSITSAFQGLDGDVIRFHKSGNGMANSRNEVEQGISGTLNTWPLPSTRPPDDISDENQGFDLKENKVVDLQIG